jgi:hypothetical protein
LHPEFTRRGRFSDVDSFTGSSSMVLRRLIPHARMHGSKDKYLLQCPACGCRAFEIQGPLIETGVVQCVACHAEIGPVDEVLAAVQARIEREEQELRKRRFH